MCLQQVIPHKRLHAQSQKRKQQKVARNMSKANNKNTKTTSLTSLWCLHHQLRLYPTLHANAPISDPDKANVHWAIKISRENTPKVKPTEVCQEPNTQSQMYHKRKIIGSQQIKLLLTLLKTIILFSDPYQTNDRVLNPPPFFLNIWRLTSTKQNFQYH